MLNIKWGNRGEVPRKECNYRKVLLICEQYEPFFTSYMNIVITCYAAHLLWNFLVTTFSFLRPHSEFTYINYFVSYYDYSWKRNHNYSVQAITFHRCNHLKVKDLKLLNSQQIHVAIINSKNVITSNLQVLAPAFSPNTDGIHVGGSKNVEIRDCLIQTGNFFLKKSFSRIDGCLQRSFLCWWPQKFETLILFWLLILMKFSIKCFNKLNDPSAGDDCISIVSNSSKIRITNLSCGPGHGIR